MAGIKNKYDFYKGFLEALGAENIMETDYKNEEELRKKILDTLGVEYVFDDVNQTDLFREKFLQGISSGGGSGSSDFSTAEVTLINSSERGSYYSIAFLSVDSENGCYYEFARHVETELTLTVPLYKGKAKFPFAIDLVTEDEPITTGGVSIDEDYEYIIITGDGTFSAKAISNDN